MKALQALVAGLVILAIVAGSVALGAAILMVFLAVASGAGFDVPAASFFESAALFVLGGALIGLLGSARK